MVSKAEEGAVGFLPQLSTMFCNLLWREYGNATKSLGLVLPFFRLSHSEDPGTYARAPPPSPLANMAMAYRS